MKPEEIIEKYSNINEEYWRCVVVKKYEYQWQLMTMKIMIANDVAKMSEEMTIMY